MPIEPSALKRKFAASRRARRVFLSLGSNVGNRKAQISKALRMLSRAGIQVRRVSSFYETEPVEYRRQPWFINCAAEVTTDLAPWRLLKALKSVEGALGRVPGIPKGPRRIDIDILLYENVVVRSRALSIPHPRMGNRKFVLVPLREIAARMRHPVTHKTALEMLRGTADTSRIVKIKADHAHSPKARAATLYRRRGTGSRRQDEPGRHFGRPAARGAPARHRG